MRYRTLLFDVGETLIGPRVGFGEVYATVLEDLGWSIPSERLNQALAEVSRAVEREIPPGTDRYRHFPGGEDEYWLRFATRALEIAGGESPEPERAGLALRRLREAFRGPEAWVVYDDVVPALERLRQRGVRLGIVSNWDSLLPDVLAMLNLDGYFDEIGVSHLEAMEKPDPSFFLRILARMDSRPEEALHIGDRPDMDLAGANSAGIDALLIDRRRRFADQAHPRIDDFAELLDRID